MQNRGKTINVKSDLFGNILLMFNTQNSTVTKYHTIIAETRNCWFSFACFYFIIIFVLFFIIQLTKLT